MRSHVKQLIRFQSSVADISASHAKHALDVQRCQTLVANEVFSEAGNEMLYVVENVIRDAVFFFIPRAAFTQVIGHVFT